MAEYLMPNFYNITIDVQRSIFALRNRITIFPFNFPNVKTEEAEWRSLKYEAYPLECEQQTTI